MAKYVRISSDTVLGGEGGGVGGRRGPGFKEVVLVPRLGGARGTTNGCTLGQESGLKKTHNGTRDYAACYTRMLLEKKKKFVN
jgi:hypothetical protein